MSFGPNRIDQDRSDYAWIFFPPKTPKTPKCSLLAGFTVRGRLRPNCGWFFLHRSAASDLLQMLEKSHMPNGCKLGYSAVGSHHFIINAVERSRLPLFGSICPGMDGIRAMQEQLPREARLL